MDFLVMHPVAFVLKRPTTIEASETFSAGMNYGMGRQVPGARKSRVTLCTFEGFFTGVRAEMNDQLGFLLKRLSTHCTCDLGLRLACTCDLDLRLAFGVHR